MQNTLTTVIYIFLSILWFVIVLIVLIFYRKNLSEIMTHLGSFEALWVKFVIIQNSIVPRSNWR